MTRRGGSPALLATRTGLRGAELLLDPAFPINKRIWTSSFVLLTSGFSFLALVGVVLLLRAPDTGADPAPGAKRERDPRLFKLHCAFGCGVDPLPVSQNPRALQQIGFELVTPIIHDSDLASLACAAGVLTFVVLLIPPLHRRDIPVCL